MRSCSMHVRDKIYVQNVIHVVAKIVSVMCFPTFLRPFLIFLPLSSFLYHLISFPILSKFLLSISFRSHVFTKNSLSTSSPSHMMPEILFITTTS
jgi:hypothetical protein